MRWYFYELTEPAKGKVFLIYHRQPTEEELAEINAPFVALSAIPDPVVYKGKSPVLFVNPDNSEAWYEYVDRPLTQEEVIEEQNSKIDTLLMMQLEKEGII